jgi:hypothetical protein
MGRRAQIVRLRWEEVDLKVGAIEWGVEWEARKYEASRDELLILRATVEDQTHLLQTDKRFSAAPYWGRSGWVAIKLAAVSPEELPTLLGHAHALIASSG